MDDRRPWLRRSRRNEAISLLIRWIWRTDELRGFGRLDGVLIGHVGVARFSPSQTQPAPPASLSASPGTYAVASALPATSPTRIHLWVAFSFPSPPGFLPGSNRWGANPFPSQFLQLSPCFGYGMLTPVVQGKRKKKGGEKEGICLVSPGNQRVDLPFLPCVFPWVRSKLLLNQRWI